MKFLLFLPLCLAIHAPIASAQSVNPFFGKWKAEWQTEKRTEEAHFTLNDKGGTWKTLAKSKSNPCVGREVGIEIVKSSPDEMTLKLKFSEAITGCTDSTLHLKRVDDKTIAGRRGKADLKLTRE